MSDALDSFLDKWRTRWPEWSVAEAFIPVETRRTALAWFALLQEFDDALNIVGDPLPADAKLAWWGQELRDWSQQRSRHPLGRVLEPQRADWSMLADALPLLTSARAAGTTAEQGTAQLKRYAEAVVAVESVLFAGEPSEAVASAVAAQTWSTRLQEHPDVAGSGGPVLAAKWLLAQWPAAIAAARPRRVYSALARLRLQRFTAAGVPAPLASRWRLLWTSWRAATGD